MFFLLRAAFWLTLVLALLPTGSSQPAAQGSQIDATDAVVAASAAVSDVSGFCGRQPDACSVGSQAAVVIGQRAQAGAKMVYEFLNDKVAHSETGSISKGEQKSDTKLMPVSFPGSQSTLRSSDLTPAWQGAAPQREPRSLRNVMMPRPDPRKSAGRPA